MATVMHTLNSCSEQLYASPVGELTGVKPALLLSLLKVSQLQAPMHICRISMACSQVS
jgi:hypothetical protein